MATSYNGTTNSVPIPGGAVIGISNRVGELKMDEAAYNTRLADVHAQYPDAPNIEGTCFGVRPADPMSITTSLATTNPLRFFVVNDMSKNGLSVPKKPLGYVELNYRVSSQVYCVLLPNSATSPNSPVAGAAANVDTTKGWFTTQAVSGTDIIAMKGCCWANFDDGTTVKLDSYGRRLALVEVL